MKTLGEILATGTLPMLRARRRQLVAYRDTLKHECERDDRLECEDTIREINEILNKGEHNE
jgi:regulator of sigma D